MKENAPVWKARMRALDAARKAFRRGDSGGPEDLRSALHHLAVTARALGHRRISRKARKIARSFVGQSRLEKNRKLLERIGRLGFLSPDAVSAMASRWEKRRARGARRAARAAAGKKLRGLRRRLERLARKGSGRGLERTDAARRSAEAATARPLAERDRSAGRRYRKAVRAARWLAEDLADLGLPASAPRDAHETALETALDRWNGLLRFRRRIVDGREEAERRGLVTRAAELERLLAALDSPIDELRAAAVSASHRTARVIPLRRAAGAQV